MSLLSMSIKSEICGVITRKDAPLVENNGHNGVEGGGDGIKRLKNSKA